MQREILTKIDSTTTESIINDFIKKSLKITLTSKQVITASAFLNSSNAISIRCPQGFLTYTNSLSEGEIIAFKALLKFMQAGLKIVFTLDQSVRIKPSGMTQVESFLWSVKDARREIHDRPLVFCVGYEDAIDKTLKAITATIPGTKDLLEMLNLHNDGKIRFDTSLEKLMLHAQLHMKHPY